MKAGPVTKPSERAERLDATASEAFDRWFAIATATDPKKRFASASDQHDALKLALGVRSGNAGRLQRLLDQEDQPALGSTLPDEDAEDPKDLPPAAAVSDEALHSAPALSTTAVPSSGGEEVDPLGDTCAGAGPEGESLAAAADRARAEVKAMRAAAARERRPEVVSPTKVAGRRVAIVIALTVIALAAAALIAVLLQSP